MLSGQAVLAESCIMAHQEPAALTSPTQNIAPGDLGLFRDQGLGKPVLKGPVLHVGVQEGLLALWVTNRERLRRFVEAELLPAWGLALAAQWVWLKVTARGALVTPLVTASLATFSQGMGR